MMGSEEKEAYMITPGTSCLIFAGLPPEAAAIRFQILPGIAGILQGPCLCFGHRIR